VSPEPEITALVDMLLAAAHPLIITESAGADPEAFHALTELCDLLAIPVVEPQSTVCSNFPRSHPMHQGGGVERFMNDETDLVLLVACRSPWYPPSAKPVNAKTVVIDETPQRPHMVYQVLHADRYLEGQVGATLRGAVRQLRERTIDKDRIKQRREQFKAAHEKAAEQLVAAEAKAQAAEQAIDPVLLVKFLREATPDDAVFVDETITHSRVIQQHLMLDQPSRYYYVQGGLGQGIGEALGVKLAVGSKLVVFTVGDGSFLYNPVLASLAAARDIGLPILIVIFNNQKYQSMKLNHLRFYPDGAAVTANDFRGVSLDTQPELSAFAEPFGMHGRVVSKPGELKEAFASAVSAVSSGRTAILNVMLSR
jgi:acetolactate synthase-1/2/3 large subunit